LIPLCGIGSMLLNRQQQIKFGRQFPARGLFLQRDANAP